MDIREYDARTTHLTPGEGERVTIRICTQGTIELNCRTSISSLIQSGISYRWMIDITYDNYCCVTITDI